MLIFSAHNIVCKSLKPNCVETSGQCKSNKTGHLNCDCTKGFEYDENKGYKGKCVHALNTKSKLI